MSAVWLIDDDPDCQSQFVEEYGQRHHVRTFESAFDAFQAMTTPDVVVIDCSAAGSICSPHLMYGPICSLIGKHPNALYFVRSGMPLDLVREVVEDVKRECPETVVVAVGWDDDLDMKVKAKAGIQ